MNDVKKDHIVSKTLIAMILGFLTGASIGMVERFFYWLIIIMLLISHWT